MSEAGDAELARDYEELASMLSAVREEAHRFRSLFDAAPSALLVTDRSLRIVEANGAACRLLAVPLRFLIDKPFPTFVDSSERRRFRAWELERARETGAETLAVRMRRRTGVAFDALVRADLGPEEIYWSITDRTDEALAEARLWELNNELEERVQEQAAEIETIASELPVGVMLVAADGSVLWKNERAQALVGEQERLADDHPARRALAGEAIRGVRIRRPDTRVVDVTAAPVASARGGAVVVVADVTERDRLERADAEFVQNAAHQLRTPITGIASSVAALDAGARDDPVDRERFLAHIGRESERIARLVEALLSLATLQRGGGRPSATLVPLRGLLDAVIAAGEAEGVTVECPPEIAVVCDADLLGQAVGNVLANAAQHSPGGGIAVRAELERKLVRLDVTDSGPGIDDDQTERVFERFYRATPNGRKGSGLGLAIARAATEATHGTLELLPRREGEGATFRFTLPGARLL